ncbi:MAG: hypothetical protein M3Z05_02960, partial [Gemmatimonadota bacterium]|nr:hypothetical protein [Gemmatimonadota bacterium]
MKIFFPALVGLALTVAVAAHAQGTAGASRVPYLDERLPFALRVDDLVGRMTLAEKVSQMKDVADPIERLGIPAYKTPDARVVQTSMRMEAGRSYRIRVEANETYG